MDASWHLSSICKRYKGGSGSPKNSLFFFELDEEVKIRICAIKGQLLAITVFTPPPAKFKLVR